MNSDLLKAVRPATPNPSKKRPKAVPVLLEFDAAAGRLSVGEAKYGTFNQTILASGDWPTPVRVDGVLLAKISKSLPPNAVLEFSVNSETLTIHTGNSTLQIARCDRVRRKATNKPTSLRRLRGEFRLRGT